MLNTNVHHSHQAKTLVPLHKAFIAGDAANSFPSLLRPSIGRNRRNNFRVLRHVPNSIKAAVASTEKSTKVKVVATVKSPLSGILNLELSDLFGQRALLLELVSKEIDHKTGKEKKTIAGYGHRTVHDKGIVKYEADLKVPADFGEVGAVLVENEHTKEMYLIDLVLDGFPNGPINISCDSFVQPKSVTPEKRIFFTGKSYLPSETPSGLKRHREKELTLIRGDGQGQCKETDRTYDYDTYNDLGDPDNDPDLARPVLGTKEYPYPRRCRTGRPPTKRDPLSESRSSSIYVPKDEGFSSVKGATFGAKTVYSVLHAVVPALETSIVDPKLGFPYFTAIDSLFNEGIHVPNLPSKSLFDILPRLLKTLTDIGKDVLLFETPELLNRDKFAWIRDVEFGRQTLAGLNPCSLRLVTEWPLKSKLDPQEYGPPESAITKDLVEKHIKGFMTVDEAVKNKKLVILDYHDLFLPYVNKVRELEGTTLYGSRSLFFITPSNVLMPVAIELTRPPGNGKPQWKQVFQPSWDATGAWLWKLAKVHVLAHDSGFHQLVSHWLRTHCCTEPYIIAANRQLSAMHPIYRLLHPHFRYTMEINALARQFLINAGGIIESSFSPGKYSLEMSSIAYDQLWQFNTEGLPADLISRGLAEEDPNSPHGLKLLIEDYPFANDGLVLWDAIKDWVTDYVNHYYGEANLVESDQELQAWWNEVRTVGHGDKKDEPWWPVLKTPADLIQVLTTIIWVTSGHHAAVNFGQYDFAAYFPNRPTIARTNMPTEDPTDEQLKSFCQRPEEEILKCFPSQLQATTVMAVLDVLSNHSPDEEYIGDKMEPSWSEEPMIMGAFERFSGRLKELEGIIDERNADFNLRNRSGVGVVSYQLLKPMSKSGVTGQGVPNSISI